MSGLIEHLLCSFQVSRRDIVKNAFDAVLLPFHPVNIPSLCLAAHIESAAAMGVDFWTIFCFVQIGIRPDELIPSIPQRDLQGPNRLGQQ